MRPFLTALALLSLSLTGCGRGEAEDIRDQIREEDYRNTYTRAPGWEDPRQPAAGGPHGDFIDIYVNETMQEAIDEGMTIDRWPEGSLLVKDGWNDAEGTDYVYLAFMERRDDGWFWGEFRGNGRFVSAGVNDKTCVGCHSAGEDQVRAFGLPTNTPPPE